MKYRPVILFKLNSSSYIHHKILLLNCFEVNFEFLRLEGKANSNALSKMYMFVSRRKLIT